MTNWPTKKLEEICEINPNFKNDISSDSEVGFLTMADVSENAEINNIQKRKLSEVKKGFTKPTEQPVGQSCLFSQLTSSQVKFAQAKIVPNNKTIN